MASETSNVRPWRTLRKAAFRVCARRSPVFEFAPAVFATEDDGRDSLDLVVLRGLGGGLSCDGGIFTVVDLVGGVLGDRYVSLRGDEDGAFGWFVRACGMDVVFLAGTFAIDVGIAATVDLEAPLFDV